MKKINIFFLILFVFLISSCNKNTKTNKYTVEFYVENQLVETQYIEEGNKINKPNNPVLNGYIFDGWFVESEEWLFSSGIVTSDIKLTAKFSKIEHIEKIVPVYQGMEASNIKAQARKNQKNIKDEVLSSIDVIETEGVDFFTSKGEKYLVTVHLYNPSSFEILSFTLDGKKYQSYEFKEGSNSTELIIELTAPNISGVKDLTIDAIKYVDATEIKDVRMEGEKTIHIGVEYEILPTCSLINEEITNTSYISSVDITDTANLLNVETDLLVFLYDGVSIVEMSNLKLGVNVLNFIDLKMNQNYEYIIVGVYDKFDGAGKCAHILYECSFKTTSAIELTNITSSKKDISFEVLQHDKSIFVDVIELYLDNNLIDTTTNLSFTNLLSNTTYKLVLKYKYPFKDTFGVAEIEYFIKTKELNIPIVNLESLNAFENVITYLVNKSDIDETISSINVNLYQGNNLISSKKELNSAFNNLESNSYYKLELIYQYDLNDGNGVITATKTFETITSKAKPTVFIKPISITNSNIYFDLIVSDSDAACEIASISLYKDKTIVQRVIDLQTRDFQGLDSFTNYEIRVVYQYDLNDGNKIVINTYSYSFNTAKLSPSISFIEQTPTFETYCCEFIINDKENSGKLTSLKLLYNNQIVNEITSVSGTHINQIYKNLSSNSTYTVEATYIYDLCDLEGVRTTIFKQTFTTPKRQIPTVELDNINVSYEEISFEHLITNPNNAMLYLKELSITDTSKKIYDPSLTTIKGLNSSKRLVLELIWVYDLKDFTGEHEIKISHEFETLTYADPLIKVDNLNTTYDTLEFNTEINYHKDIDFNILSSLLTLDDTTVKEIPNYKSVYIDNLYAGRTYKYILEYTYDLHDGMGINKVKFEKEIKTLSYMLPQFNFNNLFVDNSNIIFNLSFKDSDNLIKEIISVSLYDNEKIINSEVLKDLYEYKNLYSDHNYRLVIEYLADYKDGYGMVTKKYEQTFITSSKHVPTIEITNINSKAHSIGFNVNIKDSDNVLEIINYEIYNQGNLISTLNINDQLLFNNLNTGIKYLIRVNYKYDLQDGKGEQISYVEKEVLTVDELINITAIDVLNEGYIKAGDELHLRITIENPNELVITALKINETIVNVTDSHMINTVYIKYIPDTKGGPYKISVSGLEYKSQGLTVSQKISIPFSKTVNILGKLEVLNFEPLNDSIYFIDYITYIIEIDNGSNFEINSINLLFHRGEYVGDDITIEPTKISDNMYQVEIDTNLLISGVYFGVAIIDITYTDKSYFLEQTFVNDDLEHNDICQLKNVIFNNTGGDYLFTGIKNISSVEDFQNLSTTYECSILNITSDLDFNGITFEPISTFEGVIFGNGHKIKNISYIGTSFKGVFNTFSGYVENLTIENIYIDATQDASGFAGNIRASKLINISVDGYIRGNTYVAGIANDLKYSDLLNVQNHATIEGDMCAGISINSNYNIAIKCANYGEINSTNIAAGLFYKFYGYKNYDTKYYILECFNYGTITATSFAIGLIYDKSYVQIIKSENYGILNKMK